MRVSCDPKSPHYNRFSYVRLYGVPQMFALEADDVEGWVDVIDLPEACRRSRVGSVRPGDPWPRKRLTGEVTITDD